MGHNRGHDRRERNRPQGHRVVTRLKDVAAAASVSVKTVSNVVNGYAGVSPQLRARVEKVIAELDYHPNLSARSLRTGRTGIVALAVPALSEPYFAEVAHHVVSAARARNWTVLVDQTEGEPGREQWVIGASRRRLLDGVIMSPLGLDDRTLSTRDKSLPLVLLGERVSPSAGTDHVAIDNVAAAREATEHLLATGRRRIGVIGVQRDRRWATSHLRLRGYRAALGARRVHVDKRLFGEVARFDRTAGRRAVHELLERNVRPDALFCFNDLLAYGAIRALFEAGLRVPDDVAVVGFDDNAHDEDAVPSLTSVSPDKASLAEFAVAALSDRIGADDPPAPREFTVPYVLRVRESSAPPLRSAASRRVSP